MGFQIVYLGMIVVTAVSVGAAVVMVMGEVVRVRRQQGQAERALAELPGPAEGVVRGRPRTPA